jgi:hypothetical protein
MNDRQIEELLNFLSRIASAVEVIAKAANPMFTADYSRAKMLQKQREVKSERSRSGQKSEE